MQLPGIAQELGLLPAPTSEDQVSPKTAAALRAAMTRLFEGRPQRTDGRLTKENLSKEAQVSRATMSPFQPGCGRGPTRMSGCKD
ncbi:hypothetical protein STRMOE7_33465 [Streptomyces sp. MOE7]|nr:hypothetical protein STRMOE7_33465 [Streptomyces sp. MOE7]